MELGHSVLFLIFGWCITYAKSNGDLLTDDILYIYDSFHITAKLKQKQKIYLIFLYTS